MKKRLEVKIIDTAKRLNRRLKSEYTLLNLNDIFTGTEEFDYVAAAKLGVLDTYKTILETGVIEKSVDTHYSGSILGRIAGDYAIEKLVNLEFAEMFSEDVFELIELNDENYLKFNQRNSDNVRKIDLITWLRTQPNFYKDGALYGLSVKVNGANYQARIKF